MKSTKSFRWLLTILILSFTSEYIHPGTEPGDIENKNATTKMQIDEYPKTVAPKNIVPFEWNFSQNSQFEYQLYMNVIMKEYINSNPYIYDIRMCSDIIVQSIGNNVGKYIMNNFRGKANLTLIEPTEEEDEQPNHTVVEIFQESEEKILDNISEKGEVLKNADSEITDRHDFTFIFLLPQQKLEQGKKLNSVIQISDDKKFDLSIDVTWTLHQYVLIHNKIHAQILLNINGGTCTTNVPPEKLDCELSGQTILYFDVKYQKIYSQETVYNIHMKMEQVIPEGEELVYDSDAKDPYRTQAEKEDVNMSIYFMIKPGSNFITPSVCKKEIEN
ncbi:MAG: hypothetical protein ABUK01_04640 [Leptospirales bacterium]